MVLGEPRPRGLAGRHKYPLQSYKLEPPHSLGANGRDMVSKVDISEV